MDSSNNHNQAFSGQRQPFDQQYPLQFAQSDRSQSDQGQFFGQQQQQQPLAAQNAMDDTFLDLEKYFDPQQQPATLEDYPSQTFFGQGQPTAQSQFSQQQRQQYQQEPMQFGQNSNPQDFSYWGQPVGQQSSGQRSVGQESFGPLPVQQQFRQQQGRQQYGQEQYGHQQGEQQHRQQSSSRRQVPNPDQAFNTANLFERRQFWEQQGPNGQTNNSSAHGQASTAPFSMPNEGTYIEENYSRMHYLNGTGEISNQLAAAHIAYCILQISGVPELWEAECHLLVAAKNPGTGIDALHHAREASRLFRRVMADGVPDQRTIDLARRAGHILRFRQGRGAVPGTIVGTTRGSLMRRTERNRNGAVVGDDPDARASLDSDADADADAHPSVEADIGTDDVAGNAQARAPANAEAGEEPAAGEGGQRKRKTRGPAKRSQAGQPKRHRGRPRKNAANNDDEAAGPSTQKGQTERAPRGRRPRASPSARAPRKNGRKSSNTGGQASTGRRRKPTAAPSEETAESTGDVAAPNVDRSRPFIFETSPSTSGSTSHVFSWNHGLSRLGGDGHGNMMGPTSAPRVDPSDDSGYRPTLNRSAQTLLERRGFGRNSFGGTTSNPFINPASRNSFGSTASTPSQLQIQAGSRNHDPSFRNVGDFSNGTTRMQGRQQGPGNFGGGWDETGLSDDAGDAPTASDFLGASRSRTASGTPTDPYTGSNAYGAASIGNQAAPTNLQVAPAQSNSPASGTMTENQPEQTFEQSMDTDPSRMFDLNADFDVHGMFGLNGDWKRRTG